MRNLRTLSIVTAAGALALGAVGIAGASTGSNHSSSNATAAHARNAARHQHGHALGHARHDPTTTTTVPDSTTTTPTTTPPETVPDAVHEAVGVVSADGTSIDLRWEGSGHDEDDATVTGYLVEFSTDGGTTWTPAPDAGLATSMTLPYISGELFEVAAVNSAGPGAFTQVTIAGSSDDDKGTGDDEHGSTQSSQDGQGGESEHDGSAGSGSFSGNVDLGGRFGGSHHEG